MNHLYKKIFLLIVMGIAIHKNASSMQCNNISDLTQDPLDLIFSYLDMNDLVNCSVQNKKLAKHAVKAMCKKFALENMPDLKVQYTCTCYPASNSAFELAIPGNNYCLMHEKINKLVKNIVDAIEKLQKNKEISLWFNHYMNEYFFNKFFPLNKKFVEHLLLFLSTHDCAVGLILHTLSIKMYNFHEETIWLYLYEFKDKHSKKVVRFLKFEVRNGESSLFSHLISDLIRKNPDSSFSLIKKFIAKIRENEQPNISHIKTCFVGIVTLMNQPERSHNLDYHEVNELGLELFNSIVVGHSPQPLQIPNPPNVDDCLLYIMTADFIKNQMKENEQLGIELAYKAFNAEIISEYNILSLIPRNRWNHHLIRVALRQGIIRYNEALELVTEDEISDFRPKKDCCFIL